MHRIITGCLVAGVLFASAACGQDAAEPEDTAAPETGAPATTAAAEPTGGGATVEIGAEDYAFTDVPATVAPGTTLALTNSSEAELHELVALNLGDETRPLDELLALPEDERPGEFVGVLVAPPGQDGFAPGPPVVLTEPGRYALLCFIPQGADPEAYLAAAQEAQGGPVDVEGGPPHVALGMAAELTVE